MSYKLAFVYDHRFFRCGEKVYSEGALNRNTWSRYLASFEKVSVIGSIYSAQKEQLQNLSRVDRPGVDFLNIAYISNTLSYINNLLFQNTHLKRLLVSHDAVIVRVPGELSNNAYWLANSMDIPVGVEVVGCPWDSYWNHGTLSGKILAPIAWYRMKRIVKSSDYVVYVTKNFLQNRYPTEGRTINASNVDINIPSEDLLIEKINNLSRIGNLIIGLSGSFNVKYKGHYELLKAISVCKGKLPPLHIEMIGPGDYTWVIDLAKQLDLIDDLTIKGKLKYSEVENWLDSIDIYIHPSKQEGLPRSVIEAMSRACPVLASSVAGIPELLQNKYLHDPGNYNELSYHLIKYLNDREKLVQMARENYYKSLEYDKVKLERKRQKFWHEFAVSIEKNKRPKIVRLTTIPLSFKVLLSGQVEFLTKKGFNVLLGSSETGLEEMRLDSNLNITTFPFTRFVTPFKDLKALLKLVKWLIKEKPEIVHTHTPKAGLLGMISAKIANVPIRLHTVAGIPWMESKGLKRYLLKQVEKITYFFASHVYPNSYALRDFIISQRLLPESKVSVIGDGSSNGIDIDHFKVDSAVRANSSLIESKYEISDEHIVILFIGRLVKDKGIRELVDSFVYLSGEYNNLKLLLVGSFEPGRDPLPDRILNEIHSNPDIICTGFVEDVRPYIVMSKFLAFPTYREGFPNVPMQVGAMDRPSIVTDINGCNEIIKHEFNGLIIPPKDEGALIEAIERLINDQELYNYLSSNARESIVTKYDRKRVWPEILNEYEKHLNTSSEPI